MSNNIKCNNSNTNINNKPTNYDPNKYNHEYYMKIYKQKVCETTNLWKVIQDNYTPYNYEELIKKTVNKYI